MVNMEDAPNEFSYIITQRIRYIILPLLGVLLIGWLTAVEPIYSKYSVATGNTRDTKAIEKAGNQLRKHIYQSRHRYILFKGEEIYQKRYGNEVSAQHSKARTKDNKISIADSNMAGTAASTKIVQTTTAQEHNSSLSKQETFEQIGTEYFEARFNMSDPVIPFFVYASSGEREAYKILSDKVESLKGSSRQKLKELKSGAKIELGFTSLTVRLVETVGTLWLLIALITTALFVLFKIEVFNLIEEMVLLSKNDSNSEKNPPTSLDGTSVPFWLAPVIPTGLRSSGGISDEEIRKQIGWSRTREKINFITVCLLQAIFIIVVSRVFYISLQMAKDNPQFADQGLGEFMLLFLRSADFAFFIAILGFVSLSSIRLLNIKDNDDLLSPQRRKVMGYMVATGVLISPVFLATSRIYKNASMPDGIISSLFKGRGSPRFIVNKLRPRRGAANDINLEEGFYRIDKAAVHLVMKNRILDAPLISKEKLTVIIDPNEIVTNLPLRKLSVSIEEYVLFLLCEKNDTPAKAEENRSTALNLLFCALGSLGPYASHKQPEHSHKSGKVPTRKLARLFDFLVLYLYRSDLKDRINELKQLNNNDLAASPRDYELLRRKKRLNKLDKHSDPLKKKLRSKDETIVWKMPEPLSKPLSKGKDVTEFAIPFVSS